MDTIAAPHLQQRLREFGVRPTLQRLAVAAVLLARPAHMTAEQVLLAARGRLPGLSRATVYAVLGLFVRHGLIKALPIEGDTTVYDSNTAPHHHIYDVETGDVCDLPGESLQVSGLPRLASHLELDGVDVILRVRRRAAA